MPNHAQRDAERQAIWAAHNRLQELRKIPGVDVVSRQRLRRYDFNLEFMNLSLEVRKQSSAHRRTPGLLSRSVRRELAKCAFDH